MDVALAGSGGGGGGALDFPVEQRWAEGQVEVAGGGGEEGFAFAQGDEQQIGGAGLVSEHAFAVVPGGTGEGSPAEIAGIPAAGPCRWRCSPSVSFPVILRRSAPQLLPMRLQKRLLLPAERPDQIGAINPPTAQRLAGGLVFTDQLAAGSKADPVPVEQLVHVGGEQQAVGTAEPLAVVAIAPGLDVARHQELLPRQPRHPAGRLQLRHPMAKQPLPQPRLGERIALGAAGHLPQPLHVIEQGGGVGALFRQHHQVHAHRGVGVVFDQLQQQQAQGFAQACQVHPLIASASAGADRAVAFRQ